MQGGGEYKFFNVMYILTQVVGVIMIILMGIFIGKYSGGVSGRSNPALEFNWHPILMTVGLIFLYGNSILIYRAFRNVRKKQLKLTHATIHMLAIIFVIFALIAVFDSHNLATPPTPNMYTIHGWLGMGAIVTFLLQYVFGFVGFLVPGVRNSFKVALMPIHVYFGLFGFVLAIASALMGITEKNIWNGNYGLLPPNAVIANCFGLCAVIFGALVLYLTTEVSYKRKPIPEDVLLLTGIARD